MDDLEWKPPTEAEMKLIEARRERSDKISKLMSGYLLKGFKMLAVVCATCDTILLQDRQGTNYCVTCSELDSDTDKDNPLTSQSAAQSMVKEREMSASVLANSETAKSTPPVVQPAVINKRGINTTSWSCSAESDQKHLNGADSDQKKLNDAASSLELYTPSNNTAKHVHLDNGTYSNSGFPTLSESLASSHLNSRKRHANVPNLLEKIDWASAQLKDTGNVEYSIQLCQLIKAAAEALAAVRNANL